MKKSDWNTTLRLGLLCLVTWVLQICFCVASAFSSDPKIRSMVSLPIQFFGLLTLTGGSFVVIKELIEGGEEDKEKLDKDGKP